jgi:hypothetical protein
MQRQPPQVITAFNENVERAKLDFLVMPPECCAFRAFSFDETPRPDAWNVPDDGSNLTPRAAVTQSK